MGWQGLEVPLAGTRTAVHHKISQKKPRKTNYDFSRIFLINQNEVFFFTPTENLIGSRIRGNFEFGFWFFRETMW